MSELERVALSMLRQLDSLRRLDDQAWAMVARSTVEDACLVYSERLRELGVVE